MTNNEEKWNLRISIQINASKICEIVLGKGWEKAKLRLNQFVAQGQRDYPDY